MSNVLAGFLEKNRDTVSMDILELIRKSSNKLLKQIFEKEINVNSVNNSNKINKAVMTPKNSLRVRDIYKNDLHLHAHQYPDNVYESAH